MLKKLQIIFKFLLIFLISSSLSKAELLEPRSNIKPSEVIKIQLAGLQKNDYEFKDSGIEQTWKFAHPNNKKITGPLKKFKQMIYSESYEILLSHINNEITIIKDKDSAVNEKTDDEKDELYNKAVEIIKAEGKASTSFLQRKLQIGYNRAARIMETMEKEGIVGQANHVGKREIL